MDETMNKIKKTLIFILAVMIFAAACSGCGRQAKSGIVFPKDELLRDYTGEDDLEMEIIEQSESVKSVCFYRGKTAFYGEIYIPEGEGPFPVAVISGGFATSHYGYQSIAEMFSDYGIVSVIYDPSDTGYGGARIDDFIGWSVLTEASDIESIVSAVSKLDFVDKDNVFLWGHSMGGFASAYVGFRNPGLIKGLVLVEPAFYLNKEAKEQFPDIDAIPEVVPGDIYLGRAYYKDLCSFDIYDYMPDYDRSVLIFAGTVSPSIGTDMPECITSAEEALPSCEVLYVNGADHYFNGISMMRVVIETISFVDDNI